MRTDHADKRLRARRALDTAVDYASAAVSTLAMLLLALAIIALMAGPARRAGSPVVVDGSTTPSTSAAPRAQ